MLPYAAAIALSAFLLFQVQPLAGKYVLPWYGGSAAVWSSCLLFFQALLFLGYLYAHLLGTRLAPRRQGIVHGVLLALSLALLPLAPGSAWKPTDQSVPALRILGFLAATVGVPYFLLAANGPLLQRWYSIRSPRAPWRLYALSNLGSLAGLCSYPFLVERLLPLRDQGRLWSALYLLFAITAGVCAAGLLRAAPALDGDTHPAPAAGEAGPSAPFLVLALPLAGSLLMAATTLHLCQHVAVVPLLWILPLALYLVSFIVVFAGDRFYRRGLVLPLFGLATAAAVAALLAGFRLGLPASVGIICVQLFAGCWALHGELARLKPPPRGLTGYYLLIAAGGALGTAFVTFAAPFLFADYWEYHTALALAWGLALVAALRSPAAARLAPARLQGLWAAGLCSLLALVVVLRWETLVTLAESVRVQRNFYGSLRVVEREAGDPLRHRFELTNGGVLHGAQLVAPSLRHTPTTYYGLGSGIGIGLRAAREARRLRAEPPTLSIGCIGLGVGVITAHTIPGDRVRYYELNAAVEAVARSEFTFLRDAPAAVAVVLGDARLSLERELARGGSQQFDAFIVDAFTGDAIPAHLLTREALQLYAAHLKPGGRLFVHISNRYLDLRPLVLGLARDAGRAALVIPTLGVEPVTVGAIWALIAPGEGAFSAEEREAAARSVLPPPGPPVVWTDEYSNLLGLISRGGGHP
jgi:hypothetical protein